MRWYAHRLTQVSSTQRDFNGLPLLPAQGKDVLGKWIIPNFQSIKVLFLIAEFRIMNHHKVIAIPGKGNLKPCINSHPGSIVVSSNLFAERVKDLNCRIDC